MFSEKIQYNVPMPGEEFRARELSVPAQAVKVIYEIDSLHGEDKSLCLTILQRTFQGVSAVASVVNECMKIYKRGEESESWRHHASINRAVRVATLDREIEEATAALKEAQSKQQKVAKL